MNKKSWFTITARQDSPTAEIFLYGEIGDFGITAKDFAAALQPHKDKDLTVRINSPGGSVFDGQAIFNLLRQHPKHVSVQIDGLAASIASVIAMAGKEIAMAESAVLMIHDPSGLVAGKAGDMREMASVLDKLGGQIADIYATKTGKPKDEVLTAMAAEQWFTAQEALDWKLIDRISPPLTATARFDLTKFRNVPTALAPQVDPAQLKAELQQVNARLEASITREIDAMVAECRFPVAQREDWIARAMADGKVLEQLRAMQSNPPGAEPPTLVRSTPQQNTIEAAHAAHVERLNKFRNHNNK